MLPMYCTNNCYVNIFFSISKPMFTPEHFVSCEVSPMSQGVHVCQAVYTCSAWGILVFEEEKNIISVHKCTIHKIINFHKFVDTLKFLMSQYIP